ncbi:M50 family metallopeptidase [Janibacter hoylei]|uniref:Membrane-associated Zn-dependent protease n=1 Tax=Janibacter hoylei PVAS-1 TaxID=1210046 RepID=K1DV20_9MICO|nr:site-2 protease family protein [Janibacter hoylei]EKA60335.1 membrane-associated Zn-dependent protease [Janibacter hoylei PVAS-1]MCW4602742.1 site-2 protease family protein [Janibacter hoylei]RWU81915.1 zinc metalloprotease [Janibacter hoylei PVAS-1]
MLYVLGVLLAVLGIGLSIALHEIGHLVPAKKFGLRVPQYMVGFGPTIWSRRRGETEYGVKAIPLGGYIRMIGMFPPAADGTVRASSTGRMSQLVDEARQQSLEEIRPGDDGRMFYQLPIWKRIVIMMGGPVMNLLIALVLFTGIFTLNGIAVATPTISAVNECVDIQQQGQQAATECTDDMPIAPANAAGLKPGDTITSINGTPVSTWADVRAAIRSNLDEPLTMQVDRAGTTKTLRAEPIVLDLPVQDDQGRIETDATGAPVTERAGFLGATGTREMQKQPITAVPGLFGEQLGQTYGLLVRIPQKLVGVAEAAFGSQERDPDGPMSVVGVGRIAGEVASSDDFGDTSDKAILLLTLMGSLNLVLFAFNTIPLLPLDGGHVAGALWEAVKKGWAKLRGLPDPGPVDVAKALPLAYVVALAFIGMTLLLVYADIVKPVKLT